MRSFLVSLCILLQLAWATPVWADEDASKEYLVKAAFLYNFVKFVTWPDTAFTTQPRTLNLCVIGSNPFGDAISAIEKQSTANLKIKVATDVDPASAKSCQMVFISEAERGRYKSILAQLASSPILTVSEIDGFAGGGGMIGFVTVDNKVKLEVNVGAARQAGLRVDSMLLEVAVKVLGN